VNLTGHSHRADPGPVIESVSGPERAVRTLPGMTRTTDPHRLTSRLDVEWERLRRQPSSVSAARTWQLPVPWEIRDLQHVLEATHAVHPWADDVAAALVAAARHDQLAGRILLQRMLGGIVLGAPRYRSFRDGCDPVEIALGAAWEAIRDYDVERRQGCVVVRLVGDTLYRAFRGPLRKRGAAEQAWSPMRLIETTLAEVHEGSSPLEELARVVRLAGDAGVPADDLQLIRELAGVDSPRVLAERKGVTVRTVRNRRDRAVARIRETVVTA